MKKETSENATKKYFNQFSGVQSTRKLVEIHHKLPYLLHSHGADIKDMMKVSKIKLQQYRK